REVPLRSAIKVGASDWTWRYDARPTNAPEEHLTIRHSSERPSDYEWRRGEQVMKLSGDRATNNFAGSDFAPLDLGLEFFHWPTQLLVAREMRKGRGCDVLESRPAQASLYSRVVSWVDQESRQQGQPGLLMAEAYDNQGRLLKEFEITGFKKIEGQYQVSEMEIRNRQTKTRTRLQFDFDKQ
ncbi:MAG TPA: outer membrane lipoprotein-sorting protein, partial [Candidatus Limnocylindria bacterium]|nr:outer membrane lipoprotein-sorting protein [Candidatus Limnocylindria bacterium]